MLPAQFGRQSDRLAQREMGGRLPGGSGKFIQQVLKAYSSRILESGAAQKECRSGQQDVPTRNIAGMMNNAVQDRQGFGRSGRKRNSWRSSRARRDAPIRDPCDGSDPCQDPSAGGIGGNAT